MSTEPETVKVVLKQTLLSVNEVFVYRVPPLKTSGGHRADDWDLAKPLQTCALTVERQDDKLVILLMSLKPKEGGPPGATEQVLFAQANIDLLSGNNSLPMTHFCDAVVDSSRYFCIRIEDPANGRTAHIGVGFRERDDASNFRMALQDYERSLERERTAEELQAKYNNEANLVDSLSALTLKEGEKIHIQLKGRPTKEKDGKEAKTGTPISGVPLLKKPPPPSSSTTTTPAIVSGYDIDMVEKTHISSRSFDGEDLVDDKTVDSTDAVDNDTTVDDDEDFEADEVPGLDNNDDEWNDFQDGEQASEK